MAVLIACSMLKKEIDCLISQHGTQIETVWMEKGLHEYPEKCREHLQSEIDKCRESETVLLAYGLCGNATLGLRSGNRILIIPKFDDCIRLLLAPGDRSAIRINPHCLYFTDAWVESDKFLFHELDSYIERYGEKKGQRVATRMIQGYRQVCLVDTGVFDLAKTGSTLREAATRWGLDYTERHGSKRVLEKLLLGEWGDEFCQVGPDRIVEYQDFEERVSCVDCDD